MTKKEKAATGFGTRAASILHDIRNSIDNRLWVLTYSLEDGRQRFASSGQLIRQAGACLGLVLLRLAGVPR